MSNYEDLEKNVIDVVFDYGEEKEDVIAKGKVVNIDYDVGITIVYNKECLKRVEGDICLCINGPSSPFWDKYCRTYPLYEEKYNEMFDILVKQIKNGVVIIKTFYDILEDNYNFRGETTPPSCPYKGF